SVFVKQGAEYGRRWRTTSGEQRYGTPPLAEQPAVESNDWSVADEYEERFSHDPALMRHILQIADRIPAVYWGYLADHRWFAALDRHEGFSAVASGKIDTKTVFDLQTICVDYSLSFLGVRYDDALQKKVVLIQAQRVSLTYDDNTQAHVIRLP